MNEDLALYHPDSLLAHIERLELEGGHDQTRYELGQIEPSLLRRILENEDELRRVDSRLFEELVTELLRADGYPDVHLVRRHNAPGPDVIARWRGPSGQELEFIVECKKWEQAVGIDVVRSMIYRLDHDARSTGAMIVTTSRFTSVARAEVDRLHRWRLNLKDSSDVRDWIERKAVSCTALPVIHQRPSRTREGTAIIELLQRAKLRPSLHAALNDTCQACGSEVVCGYIDLGAIDCYDNYFHVCSGCLAHAHRERFEQTGNADLARCPFCERLW